ncbi:ComEA family DNA-binding protein [Leucobacter tenebrionis]|uniref:ComEA family DNA-binding protein n=1 Tax=Leucobacter tenebrionis TaxID=2873270 RepID=UPI001CA79F71|nr:helix-hairpin-helix domain-containing protein [Leucobacter tenebrionis]QZY52278.1 helix-hairpin-helix domain-containing protein [Leucobacter tenebrionis]
MSHVEQSETGRPARGAGVWSPEAVLERGRWREQPPPGKVPASPPALEQEERAGVRQRLSRAVAVPLLAGTAVFVLAVLIAIVAVVLRPDAGGAELLAAEGTREPVVEEPGGSTAASSAPASSPTASSPAVDASDSPVYVHVVGEVVRPGVVEVDGGTRVAEAIEAAGGATDAAMLSAVNLAREVVDGEQILVPDAEQARAGGPAGGGAGAGAGSGAAAGAGAGAGTAAGAGAGAGTAAGAGAGAGTAATGPLDLNTADSAALETLPRVGPALAQRIIEWRAANGRFESVEQLLEVPGIGSKTLEGFRELVRV